MATNDALHGAAHNARLLDDDDVETLVASKPAKKVKRWIGGPDGEWSDPTNWEGGEVPDLGDEIAVGGI
jgi:hypothetical protein